MLLHICLDIYSYFFIFFPAFFKMFHFCLFLTDFFYVMLVVSVLFAVHLLYFSLLDLVGWEDLHVGGF